MHPRSRLAPPLVLLVARSIETIGKRKILQNTLDFSPGTFKLNLPIPIKPYVLLERSNTAPVTDWDSMPGTAICVTPVYLPAVLGCIRYEEVPKHNARYTLL